MIPQIGGSEPVRKWFATRPTFAMAREESG